MGPAGPPVFAENLQALSIPLRSPEPLSIRRIAICHASERPEFTPRHAGAYYYKNSQLSIGKWLQGEGTSSGRFLPRAWPLRNMPLSCGIMELSSLVFKIMTDGVGRKRMRRQWQVSGPRPFPSLLHVQTFRSFPYRLHVSVPTFRGTGAQPFP